MSAAQTRPRFPGRSYLSLETYKRSGDGVRTTVWFVEKDGACYIRARADSWKVLRMRNDPRASVAPSSFSGKELGGRERVHARPASPEEAAESSRLFARKYNVQKWGADVLAMISGRKYLYFRLEFTR